MSEAPARTWTGDVDPLPLALYRAGFGALLCAEALGRLPHAAELFSDEGFHRGWLAHTAPSPAGAKLAVLASALSAAALALGWRTRWSALASLALWGWLYGIDQINERALHSIVLVVLALLALSDAGATLSLDARRRGEGGAAWATPWRLLQLEFAQVYFFAGVVKLFAPGWITGGVLALSLSSRWATDTGLRVAAAMPERAWRAVGLGTVLYELLAPWLLFVPWARPWVIAVGVTFHVGTQATLGVGWLGWHFALALVTLYPDAAAWRRALAWVGARGWLGRRSGVLPPPASSVPGADARP